VGPEDLRAGALTVRLAALVVAVLAVRPASRDDDAPSCPWCRDDPALLAAAGSVTHGAMPIAVEGTASLSSLPGPRWRFLETTHFRFGSNLPGETVTLKDRARVDAELDRLRRALPSVPVKPTRLDAWLRLHLFAMKCEELYARFQLLLRVKDSDFPDARGAGPYMGDGRYLGEKDKFELYLHASRKTHQMFTQDAMGVRVPFVLRWHLKRPAHKVVASIPAEEGDLKFDRQLFPHAAHVVSHLLLAAYKHQSYDAPVWVDEGLAHAMQREASEQSTATYCSDEGAGPERTAAADWRRDAASALERGKAAPFSELLHKKGYSELSRVDHVILWSKVRFLLDEHGDKFARLLGGVKGQLDEKGYPTGRDLPGLQRNLLRDVFGWTPDQLDAAWAEWMKKPPAAARK
jgi:hypothetical protein